MVDFIGKIISVILAFMIIVAAFVVKYTWDYNLGQREILNDVQTFIDKVKDTSSITSDDLNKLYLDCNSHGLTVDVSVKRLIATSVFDKEDNIAQTNYFAVDSDEALQSINAGDVVQVNVEEVTVATARKLMYRLLNMDEGVFEFTQAGVVG